MQRRQRHVGEERDGDGEPGQQRDIDRKSEEQENEGENAERQDHADVPSSEGCTTLRIARSLTRRQSVISPISPKPTPSAACGIHIGRSARSLRRSMKCMKLAYFSDCDASTVIR